LIGTTVSHYKITAKLGAGGMGEVFRAEDTQLGRDVALKLLPPSFASDPERLARFEREARVLASLSHPSIAGIHGLEQSDGHRFLVMELAAGETLAARLQRGGLEPQEAARLALRIAEALEAAHEKGVVHRDLKPANVMVDGDGRVKVLDFGLAKALNTHPLSGPQDAEASHSPTLAMTQAGVLLGTAGYMSPEQARGKPVDRRADIWAFGCVLYEMLAGRRAFDGETVTDVLGAIVHKEPDLGQLPASVPPSLRTLLQQCLHKDASRRLQSIGDARIALQEFLEHPSAAAAKPMGAAARASWLAWTVAVAAGLLGLAVGARLLGPKPFAEPVRRFEIHLTEDQLFSRLGSGLVTSPDGRAIAYTTGLEGQQQALVVRSLDRFQETVLVKGEGEAGPYHAFFSPDGQWLGFVTRKELKKIPVAGGSPITLATLDRSRGTAWGPDGTIVFTPNPNAGLVRIPATGGDTKPLTTLDTAKGEKSHRWPQWLPGGRSVLFTSQAGDISSFDGGTIEVVRVDTGERKVVHKGGYYARYIATGHLLFVNKGALFAIPFDLGKLEVTGAQMPVLEGLETNAGEGSAQYAVSDTGLLTYLDNNSEVKPFTVVAVDRQGGSRPLWRTPGIYGTPRFAPDGRRMAVSLLRDENWDVWVYDIERDVATRVTFGEGYDADPVWSPDGQWIAYEGEVNGKDGILKKRADGTGEPEVVVVPGKLTYPAPDSWSPDARSLVVQAVGAKGGQDIWLVDVDGKSEPLPLIQSPYNEAGVQFSRDGRFLAYESNETGRPEVFVSSLPMGQGKWQISDGGGSQPRWSRDGRELFYRTADGLMSVQLAIDGGGLHPGKPVSLFKGVYLGGLRGLLLPGYNFPDYDVAPSGQSFAMFEGRGEKRQASRAKVVIGWFQELERLTKGH